jgi:hypothetical protein
MAKLGGMKYLARTMTLAPDALPRATLRSIAAAAFTKEPVARVAT